MTGWGLRGGGLKGGMSSCRLVARKRFWKRGGWAVVMTDTELTSRSSALSTAIDTQTSGREAH